MQGPGQYSRVAEGAGLDWAPVRWLEVTGSGTAVGQMEFSRSGYLPFPHALESLANEEVYLSRVACKWETLFSAVVARSRG